MGRKDSKILILLLLLLTAGCVKDKPGTLTPTHIQGGNCYIVCEGNFGNGDGMLYAYNAITDSVSGDVYKATNNQQLGDVFQSMTRMGDSLYLCINNSDKIVVLDATTRKLAGIINIPKPRYIVQVSAERAYVSSLYNNKVYSINPHNLQQTGHTIVPANNTEGMCVIGTNVWVCVWDTGSNKVYAIDATNGNIIKTTTLPGYAPHSILKDKDGLLWVLSGNVVKGRTAALSRIDPSTGAVVRSYIFPAGTDPIKPVFNNTKDTLYFIEVKYDGSNTHNGIYRMSINDNALPETPFIQAAQYQYFWALGIDPATGYIYTGDPRGFVQKGIVQITKQDGTKLSSFEVGLGPGQFYFDK